MKYYLLENIQHDQSFYTLVADPRIIVKFLADVEAGDVQESQRPWVEKRVKGISKYVARVGTEAEYLGIIPNSPVLIVKPPLNIKSETVTVSDKKDTREETRWYIDLPDNPSPDFRGAINVIDGQHRILAFREDQVDPSFSPSSKYTMTFTLFENLSKDEIKKLFVVTNDRQERVKGNLLRYFQRQLGLLEKEAADTFDICSLLGQEDYSPLKGRIKFGAEKITKGYAEQQLSKILVKSKIYSQYVKDRPNGKEQIAKSISMYLKAWETAESISFQEPSTSQETATKISGLRYMLLLFPAIMDVLKTKQIKISDESRVAKILKEIPTIVGISDSVFIDFSDAFSGETPTTRLADEHSGQIKKYYEEDDTFDPLVSA